MRRSKKFPWAGESTKGGIFQSLQRGGEVEGKSSEIDPIEEKNQTCKSIESKGKGGKELEVSGKVERLPYQFREKRNTMVMELSLPGRSIFSLPVQGRRFPDTKEGEKQRFPKKSPFSALAKRNSRQGPGGEERNS